MTLTGMAHIVQRSVSKHGFYHVHSLAALFMLTRTAVGGKTYGVAKKAKVLGVKVMDEMGSGKKSDIIAGIDVSAIPIWWRCVADMMAQFMLEDSRNRTQECPKGFVVNISLGAPFSKVFNEAVKSMVDAGIFVAVAAGNEANDASRRSPASEKSVCTVAAMNSNDEHAPFSNFGSSVDIYAPGVNVLSAWIGEETSTVRMILNRCLVVVEGYWRKASEMLTTATEIGQRHIYGLSPRGRSCSLRPWHARAHRASRAVFVPQGDGNQGPALEPRCAHAEFDRLQWQYEARWDGVANGHLSGWCAGMKKNEMWPDT